MAQLCALASVAFLVLSAPLSSAAQRPRLLCGDLFAFQVLLDRHGFSPGEIDAKAGPNLRRALTAFQTTRGLSSTGQTDCETWHALGGETAAATTVTYELTADDVKGPFTERIPARLEKQRELPALEYRSSIERLSEQVHVAPSLLRAMNPSATFAAGERIQVPNVVRFDATKKPAPDPGSGSIALLVSRDESSLRATHADGTLVFFAPVSSGSRHDPLPPGEWKVTAVTWRPVFHYNPALFWDADPEGKAVSINAGPNNPVGVVWIDINREHYGLHGTPEPSRIGASESHGCVRLTNWDAARVASLVKPGTAVTFR